MGGRKKDEVHKVCAACGHESPDNMKSQRLTAFIAKNLRDTPVRKAKRSNIVFYFVFHRKLRQLMSYSMNDQ